MGILCSTPETKQIINSKPNTKFINNITNILVDGYISDETLSMTLSNDLVDLVKAYYGVEFVKILSFSARSSTSAHHKISHLHDNNKCIEIVKNTPFDIEDDKNTDKTAVDRSVNPKWWDIHGVIFTTAQYEFRGIHCWRIFVYNPTQSANIIYGVTTPQVQVKSDFEESSFVLKS